MTHFDPTTRGPCGPCANAVRVHTAHRTRRTCLLPHQSGCSQTTSHRNVNTVPGFSRSHGHRIVLLQRGHNSNQKKTKKWNGKEDGKRGRGSSLSQSWRVPRQVPKRGYGGIENYSQNDALRSRSYHLCKKKAGSCTRYLCTPLYS